MFGYLQGDCFQSSWCYFETVFLFLKKLIDLKDSGEVEQTAHSVVLLSDCTKNYSDPAPKYELICAKNRGRTGKREVVFNKNNQQFQNIKGGLVV